jgi:hypothetical protein
MAQKNIKDITSTQTVFNDTDWLILQEATGSFVNKKFTKKTLADDIKALTLADTSALAAVVMPTIILSNCGFIPVSQCALSGSVDATGYANFLSKDGANNNVKLSATSTNLYLAFANGFNDYGESNLIAKITADVVPAAWTGLTTNGTYYLWADIASGSITYGKTATLIEPDYVYAKAAAGTATKHSYVIPERKMYVDSGSSWTAVTRIFLGHVVVSGSAVNTVVTYAYKGRYISDDILQAANTKYNRAHNIGTNCITAKAYLRCLITEQGIAVNQIGDWWNDNAVSAGTSQVFKDSLNVFVTTDEAIGIMNTTGGRVGSTNWSYWRLFFVVERSF